MFLEHCHTNYVFQQYLQLQRHNMRQDMESHQKGTGIMIDIIHEVQQLDAT
jgi:hypothetical protein